jgi:uncharacterized Zn finger protein
MSARYGGFRRYVPVAERRAKGLRHVQKLRKAGHEPQPIEVEGRGRKVATSFWGQAWCQNLESYSDFANRLPRGRTYVRNGSILDLTIEAGRIRALVMGSELYDVEIRIDPLASERWKAIRKSCAGHISSLVGLLQGRLEAGVMEIVTSKDEGLFPSPQEIHLDCSCPDWAFMCKHVAATLYGVGVRLDQAPELLFTLRGQDPAELIDGAVELSTPETASQTLSPSEDLSSVFGIDLDLETQATRRKKAKTAKKKAARKGAKKKSKLAGKKAAKKKTAAKKTASAAKKKAAKKTKKTVRTAAQGSKKRARKKAAPKRTSGKKKAAKKKSARKKRP